MQPTLKVACYVDGRLEYHSITRKDIVINYGRQQFVVLQSDGYGGELTTNGVSIMPTVGHTTPKKLAMSRGSQPPPNRTFTAQQMLDVARQEEAATVHLVASFSDGVQVPFSSLPWVVEIGLATVDQQDAFLELYGYSLTHSYCSENVQYGVTTGRPHVFSSRGSKFGKTKELSSVVFP